MRVTVSIFLGGAASMGRDEWSGVSAMTNPKQRPTGGPSGVARRRRRAAVDAQRDAAARAQSSGALPPVLDLVTAAHMVGIGRTTAYRLAGDGVFPCRVLRVGAKWRVPTVELLQLLGLSPSAITGGLPGKAVSSASGAADGDAAGVRVWFDFDGCGDV
jgi:hypothetical protein